MKWVRLLLLGTGVAVALLLVAAGVAFNSSFQTWAVRRTLASHPEWKATIGSVAAGLHRVTARQVRLELDGAVLTLPEVAAEFPLLTAALERKFIVSRLVGGGWTLDLAGRSAATGAVATSEPAVLATRAFAGLFARLALPVELALDGVDCAGEVILPEARGRAQVTWKGGGLAARRDGRFDFSARATLRDDDVKNMEVRGELIATMDSLGQLVRLVSRCDAAANGRKFPRGVKLHVETAAARLDSGESYALRVVEDGRELLNMAAEFAHGTRKLDGTWKLNVRDAAVAPFALNQPLPVFVATGEGAFETGEGFAALRVSGRLSTTVSRLEVLRPELAALGELHLDADFDLAGRGGVMAVHKFESVIRSAQPIATLKGLQAFDFNPRTGELHATDGTRALLGVGLQGVPLVWGKSLFKDIEISGGYLRGDFVATPRGGGIGLRSVSSITASKVDVSRSGRRIVEQIDLRFGVVADYSPQGWQVEVQNGTASREDAIVCTLDAKAGQLAGRNEAIKMAGKFTANLPELLNQPLAAGLATITRGEAAGEFAASVNASTEVQAKIRLKNLGTVADGRAIALPDATGDLRADLGVDRWIVFDAPIVLERNGRTSDLTIAGKIRCERDRPQTIEAQVSSRSLVFADAQTLAAIFPARAGAPELSPAPPWGAWRGSLALQLGHVIWSDTLSTSGATARVRIDAGAIRIESGQAGFGEGGHVTASGQIAFEATAPQPYALTADVSLKEFDSKLLWRLWDGNPPPLIEGRFDLTGSLTARAPTLAEWRWAAGGDFSLTSKGGLFRGLPARATGAVESTGRLAGLFASAGSMLGGLTGKKEQPEIASRTEAVAEFSRGLNPISYDQLSVKITRDAAGNMLLQDFTLISPELRLTGSGSILHVAGDDLNDDSLALEFRLRARGRQGDLLKYLGVLEPQPDDFGYSACTLPLSTAGTLGRPDARELNNRLAALALEKGGLTDKAAEILNKLRGSGR